MKPSTLHYPFILDILIKPTISWTSCYRSKELEADIPMGDIHNWVTVAYKPEEVWMINGRDSGVH